MGRLPVCTARRNSAGIDQRCGLIMSIVMMSSPAAAVSMLRRATDAYEDSASQTAAIRIHERPRWFSIIFATGVYPNVWVKE